EIHPSSEDESSQIRCQPNPGQTPRTDLWPLPDLERANNQGREYKSSVSKCSANLEFKVLSESYGRFCGIEVPEQYQRQGIGSAMVLALFSRYPGVTFHNTSLNQKSGPFFQKIQREYPRNLSPIKDSQIKNWPPSA
uniref:hypothetical protein n=1 Tax=Acaricomes phytoseiuli TaxID=291968 RepID=UPI001B7FE5EB